MSGFLGINWSHPSGAASINDNELTASISEERFTRIKNDLVFPGHSIDYCLSSLKDKPEGAGISSIWNDYIAAATHYYRMSIEEMVREQHDLVYSALYEGKEVDDAEYFKHRWVKDQYPQSYWAEYTSEKRKTYPQDQINIVADYLKLDPSKVIRVEHHQCHTYYAYYGSPFRYENTTVVTVDGSGDGLTATVSIVENGEFKRIYETEKLVIGRIYSYVTLLLGMKRMEHEYKVMGLAPYGKSEYSKKVYDIFNDVIDTEGIDVVWKNKPLDSYFYFQKQLEGIRFDNIAAGIQLWVEDFLCKWISNVINETGIGTLVMSGGVSMNVKAMGKLAELPCVEHIFVPGSGSDDSNCIGAAIGAQKHFSRSGAVNISGLYMGPEVKLINETTEKASKNPEINIETDVSPERIAELLAKGIIIGRCSGRMEFGQRALGNRSILADPTANDIVPRINAAIKQRDFWMPFAPVLLDSYAERYIINPKAVESPHMTLAFETTHEGFKCMKAACHPADHTARAQILKEKDNSGLYELLCAFEKQTGRGALLNTSFNLHGYPIVNTAQDAYDVFLNSDLEGLLLEKILLIKSSALKNHNSN